MGVGRCLRGEPVETGWWSPYSGRDAGKEAAPGRVQEGALTRRHNDGLTLFLGRAIYAFDFGSLCPPATG